MNLLCVGSVFTCLCNGLKLTRARVIAQSGRHTHGLEVVAKSLPFFRRGALMNTKNRWVFGLQNKVCTAHVGRQHGFFNETVRFGPNAATSLPNVSVVR